MSSTKNFDFAACEARALYLTNDALHSAIADIRATLPSADALDREDGGDRGGKYRDESSVYHRELATRERRRGSRCAHGLAVINHCTICRS
mgnify:CR=1 FL=1